MSKTLRKLEQETYSSNNIRVSSKTVENFDSIRKNSLGEHQFNFNNGALKTDRSDEEMEL